ncbi:MAG: type II secretion system F family protein [Kiritimatiellae bacterium]|nr:type II secretion system F family protein [Kiritimatiellia bacterium]
MIIPIIISLFFMLSFSGIAYVLMQAMSAGADEYSGTYSADTAREFEDVFLFIPPRRIAEVGWTIAAAVFITVFLLTGDLATARGIAVGCLLGGITGATALKTPSWILIFLRNRRRRRFNLQLVDTLISMSNALKAGFSITQSFESVVKDGENPIAQEFDVFLQQTRVGVNFDAALANMDERIGSNDLTLVVRAIETSRKTGGNLTEIFEKISATIRERMRIENRIRTLTAQGKLQGITVGAMPIFIMIALMIVDPETMLPFLHSNVGIGVLISVAALIFCGAMVIRKIINIDV